MKRKKSRSRDRLKNVSYNISYESILDLFDYNDDEKNIISSLYEVTIKKPRKALKIVLSAIQKHPGLPQLYNYLLVCYSAVKDEDKADKTIMMSLELFPDYLFGKVNYANYLISKGRHEEVPALFDNKFDVKLLYPERDIFHYSEVLSLCGVAVLYYYLAGDFTICKKYYNVMVEIEADDYRTKIVGKQISKLFDV